MLKLVKAELAKTLGIEGNFDVSVPEIQAFGHYSSNLAMRLAKEWGATAYDGAMCNAAANGHEGAMRLAEEWGATDYGFPMRSLHKVSLIDTAPVLDPAYRDTTAVARNMAHKAGSRAPLNSGRARATENSPGTEWR